jgi:hypothetical protein
MVCVRFSLSLRNTEEDGSVARFRSAKRIVQVPANVIFSRC